MTTTPATAHAALRRLPVALGLGLTLVAGLATTWAGSVAAAAAGASVTPSGPVSIVDNHYAQSDSDPVTIPASGPSTPNPTSLDVDAVPGAITDVDVFVHSLSHTFPADLDLMLVGPGGQRVMLMSDAGSSSPVSDIHLAFDDEAPSGLPQFTGLVGGFFRPTNFGSGDLFPAPAPDPAGAATALSVFDGTSANGIWQLFVVDDTDQDSGVIAEGWELRFETTSGSQPYPAGVTVSGAPGTVTDVDVLLNGYSDPVPSSVDLLLVGPTGQRAVIMSDAGGVLPIVDADLVLDDEAAVAMPATAMTSGRYRPTDLDVDPQPDVFPAPAPDATGAGTFLSIFDGTDPNGVWQLYAVDDVIGHPGVLSHGWSLQLTTTAPAPAATTPPPPAPKVTDVTGPRLSRGAPVRGATAVGVDALVSGVFSEPVRRASLTRSTVKLLRKGTVAALPARVGYDAGRRRVTLDPTSALRRHTTYRVVLTTWVQDLAGNRLDQDAGTPGRQRASWTFTTR
jgi:subtilisin-like proprotein convertase family protein